MNEAAATAAAAEAKSLAAPEAVAQTWVYFLPMTSDHPVVATAQTSFFSPVVTPDALADGVLVPQHESFRVHLVEPEHVDPASPAFGAFSFNHAAVSDASYLVIASFLPLTKAPLSASSIFE